MPFHHSTIRTAVLLFPLFCGEPMLAQDEPPPNGAHSNPVQMGVTGESKHHRCFEQPHGAKDAIHRLPASAGNWLAEDAIYIITPEERCAFLRVETDEERNQFIEQFWYRRASDLISLDYDSRQNTTAASSSLTKSTAVTLPGGKRIAGGSMYCLDYPILWMCTLIEEQQTRHPTKAHKPTSILRRSGTTNTSKGSEKMSNSNLSTRLLTRITFCPLMRLTY
jgi:hypothetical protein